MEGQVVEGERRPSSDLATHLVLYRAFPACRAVAHTHSRKAAAWAQAERDIPVLGTTHSDYFYGPVPCTRRMTPDEISSGYERETGTVITETFTRRGIDPAAVPGVLVACHGPFTWGTSPQDAVHNSVVLEELAAMALDTLLLNGSGEPFQQELLDKHFLRKHGKHAYYGQR
jgi:L-ribulose-5-phosphate 4-epimerase